MTEEGRKLRIALAVLEHGHGLAPMIGRIVSRGTRVEQIGLVLLASTLRRLAVEDGSGEPHVGELLRCLEELPATDGDPIVASPCLVEPLRNGVRLPAIWQVPENSGAAPRLARDLERQVRGGSVVIAVEARSLSEQWQSARILLEGSASPVLALEYTYPSAD